MLRVIALGLVVVASLGVDAATRAQSEAAPEPCLASDRLSGTPAPDGLRFTGDAGEQVTAEFELPEGTVIYSFEMAGGEDNNIITLMKAPGSEAGGFEGIANEVGPTSGTGATSVFTSGAFILDVNAAGPWSVSFEF